MLIVNVPLPPAKYPTLDQRNRFAQEMLERVGALPGRGFATIAASFGCPQSPFTSRRHTATIETDRDQPGGSRITCALLAFHYAPDGCSTRPGPSRRSRRGESTKPGRLWRRGEPIGARCGLRAGASADPTRPTRAGRRGHDHRHRCQHAKCRPSQRSDSGGRHAVFAHRSAPALDRGAAAGDPNCYSTPVRAQVRRWMRINPSPPESRSADIGQEVIQPAVHDGAVHRGSRPWPHLAACRNLQRPLVPCHTPHARARRPNGARRAAPPRARPHVDDGEDGSSSIGLVVGVAASLASMAAAAQPVVRRATADPLAYASVAVVLGFVA